MWACSYQYKSMGELQFIDVSSSGNKNFGSTMEPYLMMDAEFACLRLLLADVALVYETFDI